MGFAPPKWQAEPSRTARLKVSVDGKEQSSAPVDRKPHYTFGRDKAQDFVDDADSVSPLHAALVHHSDGRIYLIDLKSAQGTTVNGNALKAHKPVQLKNGATLSLGTSGTTYSLECSPTTASKRKSGDQPAPPPAKKQQLTMRVRASHLLVKHRDSRRPSSWKEETITRSAEEALEKIKGFRAQLTAADDLPAAFAALAAVESHCSSAKRGGDLGQFGPGEMQAAFEDATTRLEVGQLSEPVKSDSGVHLILRTE